MFTKQEKEWIEKCKNDNSGRYEISVDNDCVWVSEKCDKNLMFEEDDFFEYETVFTFNDYGQDFIVNLLKHIGCNAEHC